MYTPYRWKFLKNAFTHLWEKLEKTKRPKKGRENPCLWQLLPVFGAIPYP